MAKQFDWLHSGGWGGDFKSFKSRCEKRRADPANIIVTHQPDGGYAGFLLRVIASVRAHEAWLETQLMYARSDKWSGWVAAIGLAVVCLLMWWQWPAPALECRL